MAKDNNQVDQDGIGDEERQDDFENESSSGSDKIKEIATDTKTKWATLIFSIIIAIVGTIILSRYVLWPKYKNLKEKRKVVQKDKDISKNAKFGPVYKIDNLTVNPFGSNGLRFVIAEVALEVKNENMVAKLKKRDPQLKDLLIRFFREKSTNQILAPSFQDSSATQLKQMINKRLYDSHVDSLYFLKLVVQ